VSGGGSLLDGPEVALAVVGRLEDELAEYHACHGPAPTSCVGCCRFGAGEVVGDGHQGGLGEDGQFGQHSVERATQLRQV
jgi:hypothetical protein